MHIGKLYAYRKVASTELLMALSLYPSLSQLYLRYIESERVGQGGEALEEGEESNGGPPNWKLENINKQVCLLRERHYKRVRAGPKNFPLVVKAPVNTHARTSATPSLFTFIYFFASLSLSLSALTLSRHNLYK